MSRSVDTADLDALIAYGHSTAKAFEIAMDAARGDTYALQWLKHIRPIRQPDYAALGIDDPTGRN